MSASLLHSAACLCLHGISLQLACLLACLHSLPVWTTFLVAWARPVHSRPCSDIAFVVVFAAECALKLLALGPPAYLRSVWNRLDAAIVLISLVSLIAAALNLTAFRMLMLFRIQRLLRMLKLLR